MSVTWMIQTSLLLKHFPQAFVIGLEGISEEEKAPQGRVALMQAVPTMSLCDCVAPYIVIPFDGAAGCGVSGWI